MHFRRSYHETPYPLLRVSIGEESQERALSEVLIRNRIGEDVDFESWANLALSRLDHPRTLSDVDRAAERLVQAIEREERIALVTDHDVDGCTSHAVLKEALVRFFGVKAERIDSFIGHRLKEGYGLSEGVLGRILAQGRPAPVLISADCGSSDEPRIAALAAQGVDVIVTDHHEMPEAGPPASAYACVSPIHPQGDYPDRKIAGVMVAWLLMCRLRERLIETGRLPADAPHLVSLLDFVALGTVADCVSLGDSKNNRAVVAYGLKLIDQRRRPCWQACEAWVREGRIDEQALAFAIGPRLNARGRLDEAMSGVRFLLSRTPGEARQLGELLDQDNTERKRIEREMQDAAMAMALEQYERGAKALTITLANGHSGVHGIVASRLVERFGLPVLCLSPNQQDSESLSGSLRSVEGLHIREVLAAVNETEPGVVRKFGGHAMAAGVTIEASACERFCAAFEREAARAIARQAVTTGPRLSVDLRLAQALLEPSLLDELQRLAPYGRGFEPPSFIGRFWVVNARRVGDGSHLSLRLRDDCQRIHQAIWFSALDPGDERLPELNDALELIYTPSANWWRGERQLQLQVQALRVEACDERSLSQPQVPANNEEVA